MAASSRIDWQETGPTAGESHGMARKSWGKKVIYMTEHFKDKFLMEKWQYTFIESVHKYFHCTVQKYIYLL